MAQLLLHLIGDYLLQSGWMAANKAKSHFAAFVHALVYSLPFLLIRPSLNAWLVIFITHFFIDRYSLAKRVAIIKNYLAPRKHWPKNGDLSDFGYHKCTPEFLAMWLLIITDNTLHLLINFVALKYL
tara:strand:+ start:222 stop:602 length:381 start_codon:yes stop_codon:yes gene_type:complete